MNPTKARSDNRETKNKQMKKHTTNNPDTFIEIAEDSNAVRGEIRTMSSSNVLA